MIGKYTTRNFGFRNCHMQLLMQLNQLHVTHAIANLCSCIGHAVACDITYATCIYGVSIHVHRYIPIQCRCTLCATFLATTYN